jgi:hypothetical protein
MRRSNRRRGRPRKLRIAKKARTRAFGHATKGAKTPSQIRAAAGRERVRSRRSWSRSKYKRRRYG